MGKLFTKNFNIFKKYFLKRLSKPIENQNTLEKPDKIQKILKENLFNNLDLQSSYLLRHLYKILQK